VCRKDCKFPKSESRLSKLEQRCCWQEETWSQATLCFLKKVYFKLRGTDVQCFKSHTFVDLADKSLKLQFISVPIKSASHLQLTHSLGHSLGQSPDYRIWIPDLRWIQELGWRAGPSTAVSPFNWVVPTPTQQTGRLVGQRVWTNRWYLLIPAPRHSKGNESAAVSNRFL
jgi:hypothetical protein